MSTWDIINTEWDPDQETVNFGTRQFVVVDSAIYDVVTLATIESQGLVISQLFNTFQFALILSFLHRAASQSPVFAATSGSKSLCWRWKIIFTFSKTAARLY